jgi:hypothetical protein
MSPTCFLGRFWPAQKLETAIEHICGMSVLFRCRVNPKQLKRANKIAADLGTSLPETWLTHHERRSAPLPEAFKEKILKISPAQIERLLRPARVQHPRKGLSATRVLAHSCATRCRPAAARRTASELGPSRPIRSRTAMTAPRGDYVNSLTFTELFSGWTENRWSQFTNHFKPTFKLQNREKKGSRTVRIYEQKPQTPYQRLLASPDIAEATKARLRAEHAALDPFELKKSIEVKLRKFFTALGNLNRESTKT